MTKASAEFSKRTRTSPYGFIKPCLLVYFCRREKFTRRACKIKIIEKIFLPKILRTKKHPQSHLRTAAKMLRARGGSMGKSGEL